MIESFDLVISDASTLTDWSWAAARGDVETAVRLLRGHKMTTSQSLYDEIAAALQFPYYFGENLDALDECLRDLPEWLPASGYLLIIRDAVAVLSEATDPARALGTFLGLLARVRADWGTTTPFAITLHATPDDAPRLRARLAAAGATFRERALM